MNKTPCYFYDKNSFSWTKLLEKNWQKIRGELLSVLNEPVKSEPNSNWASVHPYYKKEPGKPVPWRTYDFFFWKIKHAPHCAKCPNTVELLNTVNGIITAQFSVMEPYAHILPHKGYSRMVLRGHLGLIIPNTKKCMIRVGEETRNWKEGEVIIFDDSYEHEAWNKTEKPRAVLMFDIANPEIGYTAEQICRYKIENISDPFMLKIGTKEQWMNWYKQGFFPI
jgi:ornithine lipid ester-linked acyl 2-hydroxylase